MRFFLVPTSFGKRSGEVNRDAAGTVLPALSPLAVDTAFGYTGADWDGDVGLTNHDARWYDSNTGRWLSQDPIGFAAGDPNLYRYVGNQPTMRTDPSGLKQFVVNIRYYLPSPILDVTPGVKVEVERIIRTAFRQCANSKHGLTIIFTKLSSQIEYDRANNGLTGIGLLDWQPDGVDIKINENPKLANLGGGHVAQGSGFAAGVDPKKFAQEVRRGANREKALAAVIVHELLFHGCYKDYTLQRPHIHQTGFVDAAKPAIGGDLSPEAAQIIIEALGAD